MGESGVIIIIVATFALIGIVILFYLFGRIKP